MMTIHSTIPTTHAMITITTLEDESLLSVCLSFEASGGVIISVVEVTVLTVAVVTDAMVSASILVVTLALYITDDVIISDTLVLTVVTVAIVTGSIMIEIDVNDPYGYIDFHTPVATVH